MTSLLSHTHHSLNNSFNMASFSNNSTAPLFDWGINRSYEDSVNLHVPSGEHNDLVASIIQAERRGDKFIKSSLETPFDITLCVAQNEVKEKEAEEKRLLASLQKIKDELSHLTVNSESEPEEADEDEDEDEGAPEIDLKGPREKGGKPPKWAQSFNAKKDKAREALKRKGLLTSLKTQSETLAEVRAVLAEQRLVVSKNESLQRDSRLLHKALLGAERKYRETHDQEFLVKNVHHNMAIWAKKSAPLLPPPKMVQRLVGSPGSFRTVMVEDKRPVLPLSEYLREDW